MSRESLKDIDLYRNVYIALNESEYNTELSQKLMSYFSSFLDRYRKASETEDEYLSNDEQYKKFRSYFFSVYKKYGTLNNAKFAIPLFIYLYDSNPLSFSLSKYDAFVSEAEDLDFSELLGIYDVFEIGMHLGEEQGRGRLSAV